MGTNYYKLFIIDSPFGIFSIIRIPFPTLWNTPSLEGCQ